MRKLTTSLFAAALAVTALSNPAFGQNARSSPINVSPAPGGASINVTPGSGPVTGSVHIGSSNGGPTVHGIGVNVNRPVGSGSVGGGVYLPSAGGTPVISGQAAIPVGRGSVGINGSFQPGAGGQANSGSIGVGISIPVGGKK